MGKRYTLPIRLTAEENEQLYLFRELTEEEQRCALENAQTLRQTKRSEDLETMKQIQSAFGVRLWKEEDDPNLLEPLEMFDDDEPLYVGVFSHSKKLFTVLGTKEQIYHSMVRVIYQVRRVHFTKTDLVFDMWAKIENPYHLQVGDACLAVSDAKGKHCSLVQEGYVSGNSAIRRRKYLTALTIPISTLADYSAGENSLVHLEGNPCKLEIQVNDITVQYTLVKRPSNKKRHGMKHSIREVWVPICSVYDQDMALHVRRAFRGGYIVYKRHMQTVEYDRWFRFMESRPVSAVLFQLGRILNHLPFRKKVALFYEKYSEKAEEGTYELCRLCASSKRTRCYFVIDEHAPDYQRIKDDPCVVRKYSLKYYWLFFNINYFIATDAPMHLNLMNANNRYIRWTCIRHPFFFLQHGITYMKRHGKRSTYLKDHPGEAKYMIVSGEKEKQVVADTFHINPDHIFKTGMLMFDNCAYRHITQASPDKITIMLTWKPYEESLDNYEDSTYYRYTLQVYNLLLNYVDRSQINIVAHPRAYDLLMTTSLHDLVWTRPISEVLKESKLLITDYSSVCWNSFYQGGGVVFFQPDLKEYEAFIGELIPKADEYIGPRCFRIKELNKVLDNGLKDGVVQLDKFRSEEYERRYNEINEFHDGQNTRRVYEVLREQKII
ncbi:MAG: CDP-glycerol glycerophosphotransferase family protein [Clostridiales bacterium]|nr:CDP-glycerol glycerophosphotransferase family protein [Clostridiales bacterium]